VVQKVNPMTKSNTQTAAAVQTNPTITISPDNLEVSLQPELGLAVIAMPREGISIKGGKVTGPATLQPSKTGKTLLVASTHGFQDTGIKAPNGEAVKLNLTAYVKPLPDGSAPADPTKRPSGDFAVSVPGEGEATSALSQEMFVLVVPYNPEPGEPGVKTRKVGRRVIEERGKMRLYQAIGKLDIGADVSIGDQPVVVNLTLGYKDTQAPAPATE